MVMAGPCGDHGTSHERVMRCGHSRCRAGTRLALVGDGVSHGVGMGRVMGQVRVGHGVGCVKGVSHGPQESADLQVAPDPGEGLLDSLGRERHLQ